MNFPDSYHAASFQITQISNTACDWLDHPMNCSRIAERTIFSDSQRSASATNLEASAGLPTILCQWAIMRSAIGTSFVGNNLHGSTSPEYMSSGSVIQFSTGRRSL